MLAFPCPYLRVDVELTDEREQHILLNHPELLPNLHELIAVTLANPDEVRASRRSATARLFSRWFATIHAGKHVVVVVLGEGSHLERRWIVTAYLIGKVTSGEVIWQRT